MLDHGRRLVRSGHGSQGERGQLRRCLAGAAVNDARSCRQWVRGQQLPHVIWEAVIDNDRVWTERRCDAQATLRAVRRVDGRATLAQPCGECVSGRRCADEDDQWHRPNGGTP